MVRISGSHPGGPGSIPGGGIQTFCLLLEDLMSPAQGIDQKYVNSIYLAATWAGPGPNPGRSEVKSSLDPGVSQCVIPRKHENWVSVFVRSRTIEILGGSHILCYKVRHPSVL